MTELEKAEEVWEAALRKWRGQYFKSQKQQNKAFEILAAARKVWDAAKEKPEAEAKFQAAHDRAEKQLANNRRIFYDR